MTTIFQVEFQFSLFSRIKLDMMLLRVYSSIKENTQKKNMHYWKIQRTKPEDIPQKNPKLHLDIPKIVEAGSKWNEKRNQVGNNAFKIFFGGMGDPRHLLESSRDFVESTASITQRWLEFKNLLNSNWMNFLVKKKLKQVNEVNWNEILTFLVDKAAFVYHLWLGLNFPPPQYSIFTKLIDTLMDLSENYVNFQNSELTKVSFNCKWW